MLQVTDETSRSVSLEAFQMYYIMRQFLHNKSLIYGYCQARRIYKVALYYITTLPAHYVIQLSSKETLSGQRHNISLRGVSYPFCLPTCLFTVINCSSNEQLQQKQIAKVSTTH